MIAVTFVMRVFLSQTVLSVFSMIHLWAFAHGIPCFYYLLRQEGSGAGHPVFCRSVVSR